MIESRIPTPPPQHATPQGQDMGTRPASDVGKPFLELLRRGEWRFRLGRWRKSSTKYSPHLRGNISEPIASSSFSIIRVRYQPLARPRRYSLLPGLHVSGRKRRAPEICASSIHVCFGDTTALSTTLRASLAGIHHCQGTGGDLLEAVF